MARALKTSPAFADVRARATQLFESGVTCDEISHEIAASALTGDLPLLVAMVAAMDSDALGVGPGKRVLARVLALLRGQARLLPPFPRREIRGHPGARHPVDVRVNRETRLAWYATLPPHHRWERASGARFCSREAHALWIAGDLGWAELERGYRNNVKAAEAAAAHFNGAWAILDEARKALFGPLAESERMARFSAAVDRLQPLGFQRWEAEHLLKVAAQPPYLRERELMSWMKHNWCRQMNDHIGRLKRMPGLKLSWIEAFRWDEAGFCRVDAASLEAAGLRPPQERYPAIHEARQFLAKRDAA